jgi:ankyrin repeat protein
MSPETRMSKNKEGKTAFLCAVERGEEDIYKFLLEAGEDPNITDENDDSALHIACKTKNVEIVKYVYGVMSPEKRSSINKEGKTAFLCAAEYGNKDICKFLLEHGADPNYSEIHYNESALHLACRYKHLETAKYICDVMSSEKVHSLNTDSKSALEVWGVPLSEYLEDSIEDDEKKQLKIFIDSKFPKDI